MTEELYVIHSFKNAFSDMKNRRIAIYGKGPKTKLIIDTFPDYEIVGIIDNELKEGEIFGKPIIQIEKVKEFKIDLIVVVARTENTRIIYKRIGELCWKNGILLYGINGKNLMEYFGIGDFFYINSLSDFQDKGRIYEAIDSHNIVCFDIIDVLIMRKVLKFSVMIELLEKRMQEKGIYLRNFRLTREKLGEKAEKKYLDYNEIYQQMAESEKIDLDILEKVRNLELDLERQIFIAREGIKNIFDYASKKNKKIYLVEKSCIDKKFVSELLSEKGYKGYEKIFLSCEEKMGIEDILCERIYKEEKCERIFYLGCQVEGDIKRDQAEGVDTYYIESASKMLQVSLYGDILKRFQSLNEKVMIGLWAARLFNDPFVLYHSGGRAEVTKSSDLGYLFAAPMLTTFMLWLFEKLQEKGYNKVLFAARDGYLLLKLYNFLVEKYKTGAPEGIYFYTSRRVCAGAAIKDNEDIKWLAEIPCYYSMEELLRDRFELEENEITPYHSICCENAYEYALFHQEKIYVKSKATKNNYFKYMKKIGLEIGGTYAFVDFCSIGTCQWFLEQIVPFGLDGFYFCKYFNETNRVNGVKVKSLFENLSTYSADTYFYEHYLFLETIMTSLEPSLFSFDNNGNPRYGREERTEEQINYVVEIQKAIEDYFKDYTNLYIKGEPLSKEISDVFYSFMGSGYMRINCRDYEELVLEDGLGRGPIKVIEQNR